MLLRLFLLAVILFAASLPAEALFRRHAPALVSHHRNEAARKKKGLNALTPLQRSNSTTESYTAFVGLMAALVCFGAFALTGMGLFLIPMFAFAVFAIVTGSIGIHRMKRGFALAGLLGGFLCLVGGFVALALL